MFSLTAIIIDDERPAREELVNLLQGFKQVTILALCKNVEEAKNEIMRFSPDVIFLDINMPGKNGFDLLEELKTTPYIVFVTAYDEYAIKAFEKNALDYLLKPVTSERLSKTIERIGKNVLKNTSRKNFFIKEGTNYTFIPIKEIYLIESFGNCIKLHHKKNFSIQSGTLLEVLSLLPSEYFFQINRKQIINKSHVNRISNTQSRKLKIEIDNQTFYTSIRRTSSVKKFLTELFLIDKTEDFK